jgi:hypothetical protein
MNFSCSCFHTSTTIHERGKRDVWEHTKWHMNTCKKDILDYTKMAHECLPKIPIKLNKNGTRVLAKKTYGTTQI